MRDLYKAYSAVHDTTISEELTQSRDQISEMNLNQMLKSDLVEVCEEIVEGLFQYGLGLEEACDVVATVLEGCVDGVSSKLRSDKITQIAEAFETVVDTVTDKAERNCEEEFLQYRHNKPLTEKWNNKVSHEVGNQKLHSALIHEDRENIKLGLIEMISNVIEARNPGESPQAYADRMKKKFSGGKSKTYDPMKDKNFDHDKAERTRGSMEEGDSSYLETDMKKREKNNEKARKDMEKVPGQKNPHFEEVSTLRQGWTKAYGAVYEKKMDPVGQEDGDIDNDGDKDSSDKYLAKRRKAIGKAMKKEGYMPMNKAKVDSQKKKAYDKDMMAQSKGDTKEADKQFKRRMAMDSQTKMKKEEVSFSETELKAFEQIVNSWVD